MDARKTQKYRKYHLCTVCPAFWIRWHMVGYAITTNIVMCPWMQFLLPKKYSSYKQIIIVISIPPIHFKLKTQHK